VISRLPVHLRDFPEWTGTLETQHSSALGDTPSTLLQDYDIFEGTEQIQQLVISRAISGMQIE